MQFFTSPEDVSGWVKSQPSAADAVSKLLQIVKKDQNGVAGEEDIRETCEAIYDADEDGNASKVLFGVLAKHNIAQVKAAKGVDKMNKVAQPVSRQRNEWVRGMRNKWNRVVDGFNEGTPWRIDRDKFYNFTHYYTDDLRFDEDPTHVYSGEAIWRMYIMDKFTADYQDKDGRVIGGYINDRFYRFPTAGTPANPDVDRLQGNQMELAPGERTRKPRPHQYSTERRLEEARGNETYDLDAIMAKSKAVVKLASQQPIDKDSDKIYNIFVDTLDMREAGIDYETMLEAVSDHYKVSIMGVAQIDKIAQDLKEKHKGIMYFSDFSSPLKAVAQAAGYDNFNFQISDPNGASGMDQQGQTVVLPTGTVITKIPASNMYEIVEDPVGGLQGKRVQFANMNFQVSPMGAVQDAAAEVGLVDEAQPSQTAGSPTMEEAQDFPVEEVVSQNY
jgi:hypothetical protein